MEAEESKALAGPLQLVDLSQVINSVTEQAYRGLRDAVVESRSKDDEERRRDLLLHLHCTRQQLLRLQVLTQWSNKAKAVAEVSNVLEKAATHANALRDAADQLFHQHNDPFLIRAPAHDVPTALEVLQTGNYRLLPAVIETLRPDPDPTPQQRKAAIELMDHLLRVQLLKEEVPPGLQVQSIANGAVEFRQDDAFEVKLILVPAPQQLEENSPEAQSMNAAARQAGEPSTSGRQAEADICSVEDREKEGEPEEWRWRIMSLTILPGERKDFWMNPSQTTHLTQKTDELMWRMADWKALKHRKRGRDAQAGTEEGAGNTATPLSTADRPSKAGSISSGGLGRTEDRLTKDEGVGDGDPVPPLQIMQRVLSMTAYRLVVLEAMRWAQMQVEDKELQWHGLIKRDPARMLAGGRVSYWPRVMTISAEELRRIDDSASSAHVEPTAMPALEVGMDSDCRLKVVSEPELRRAEADGTVGQPVNIGITMHTADLEGCLLDAAALTADIQLAGLMRLLKSRGDILGNKGQVGFEPHGLCSGSSTSELAAGNMRGHSSGVLYLSAANTRLLCISIQLLTGQMLLRAGESLRDSPGIVSHIRGEEEKLFVIQKATRPNGVDESAGRYALLQIARSLEKLFLQLCLRQQLLAQAAAVSSFGLCTTPLPARAIKEYLQSNPLAPRFSSKHIMLFSFPIPPPLLDMLPTGTAPAKPSTLGRQQDAARVARILGDGGSGLQFFLSSELKPGMCWEYGLMVASLDSRGRIVKVLKLIKVPKSRSSDSEPQNSGIKRKREDVDGVEDAVMEGDLNADRKQNNCLESEEQDKQGNLKQILKWCRHRITWEQLSIHLQVLGLPFQRAFVPIARSAKRLKTSGSQIMGPATPAEMAARRDFSKEDIKREPFESSAPATSEHPWQAASEANLAYGLHNRLWINHLPELQALDPDAAGPDPLIDFSVLPVADSNDASGLWRVDVASGYLAHFQNGQPGSSVSKRLPSGGLLEVNSQGVSLTYSSAAGATAWTALQDLSCIARLHIFMQRARVLCRAKAASEGKAAKPRGKSQEVQWTLAGSGTVSLRAVGMATAQVKVHAAADWEAPAKAPNVQPREGGKMEDHERKASVEVQNPLTPPESVFDLPDDAFGDTDFLSSKSVGGVGNGRRLSDIFGDPGFGNDGIPLDSLDLQPFRVRKSEQPVALSQQLSRHQNSFNHQQEVKPSTEEDSVALPPTCQPSSLFPPASPTPVLSMEVYWAPPDADTGHRASRRQVTCLMEGEPPLPRPVVATLEEMAGAGEEEVLLDSLCICAAPMSALLKVLQPSMLADVGLHSSSVVLQWPRPPYRARLLVQTEDGCMVLLEIRFYAASVVWLSPAVHRDKGSGVPSSDPHTSQHPWETLLEPLFSKLAGLPGVSQAEAAEPSGAQVRGAPPADCQPGFWIRTWVLEDALKTVLRFAAGLL